LRCFLRQTSQNNTFEIMAANSIWNTACTSSGGSDCRKAAERKAR
jgi:hypothetical protein